MVLEQLLPAILQLYGNEPFYFQQDSAPPHYHRDIRSYLDETPSGQWIGQRASVECSHANLTPLNYYLWGSLKNVVYHRKPPTLEKLQEEIETSCAAISVDTSATVAHALVR
jgi:hypothetical protein